MKCKPGDIAVIRTTKCAIVNNQLVEVMYRTPEGVSFKLPDGVVHKQTKYEWVVKLIGFQVPAPMDGGWTRMTNYFAAPDRVLFPLRDEFEEEEYTEAEVTR